MKKEEFILDKFVGTSDEFEFIGTEDEVEIVEEEL